MRTLSAVLLTLLIAAAAAHAQPAEPDPAALEDARKHFEEGTALLDAGKYDQAIVEFEKSYELARRPSALFMLATTYRRRWETFGNLADARQARQLYDNFVKAAPDHASVPYAREQMSSLDKQIKETESAEAKGVAADQASGSPEYRKALGLVAEGQYQEALLQADAARRVAGTGPAQLARIWVIAGRAHALAGRPDDAVAAFQRALSIEPELQVALDMDAPDGQAFARAQQGLRGKAPLAISADAPPAARAGRGLTVKANVDSDPMKIVVKVAVRYRLSDSESFSEVGGAPGKPLEVPAAVLPAKPKSYKIFYYVVGYDDAGAIAATWGSARDPRQLEVLTHSDWSRRFVPAKPIYKKWWFWSSAAAVVAVGGTILYLSLSPETGEGPHIPAPLGPIVRF